MIYEVKSGAGSIQLLTANPDKLDEAKSKNLKAVGIEIPSMKYVYVHSYSYLYSYDTKQGSKVLMLL